MKFPEKVVCHVSELIAGLMYKKVINTHNSNKLVIDFFRCHGYIKDFHLGDLFWRDFTYEKIKLLNQEEKLTSFIESVINNADFNRAYNCPLELEPLKHEELAIKIDKYLRNFGYRIIKVEGNYYGRWCTRYEIEKTVQEHFVSVEAVKNIINSNDDIKTQIKKAEYRISRGEYDGAITIARLLVEEVLIYILEKNGKENPRHGNLLELYKEVKKLLNFDPEKLPTNLKGLISAFNNIVHTIAELRNTMSDSHKKIYEPEKHHAKLVVNSAFTICEFLIESLQYQKTN